MFIYFVLSFSTVLGARCSIHGFDENDNSQTVDGNNIKPRVNFNIVISSQEGEESTEGTEATDLNNLNHTLNTTEPNSSIEASDCKDQDSSKKAEESAELSHAIVHYPYVISIKRKSSHYATGALMDKHWVLTVAKEFYNARESMKLFRVVLGSVDCKRGGETNAIKVIELHPFFVPGRPGYDISLVKLAWPVRLSDKIQPMTLAKVDADLSQDTFQSVYWPRIVINNTVLPQNAKERVKISSMRVSEQEMRPWQQCSAELRAQGVSLPTTSLCLEPIKMFHTTCLPDPGAPIVGNQGLWGVSSGWTPPNCTNQTSTVFTRVTTADVRRWIRIKMGYLPFK